jgi:hypothetical protein
MELPSQSDSRGGDHLDDDLVHTVLFLIKGVLVKTLNGRLLWGIIGGYVHEK